MTNKVEQSHKTSTLTVFKAGIALAGLGAIVFGLLGIIHPSLLSCTSLSSQEIQILSGGLAGLGILAIVAVARSILTCVNKPVPILAPIPNRQAVTTPPGLVNGHLENRCYIHSTVQSLFSLAPFCLWLNTHAKTERPIVHALQQLLTEKCPKKRHDLIGQIKSQLGITHNDQDDAYAFLATLVAHIQQEIGEDEAADSAFTALFQISTKTTSCVVGAPSPSSTTTAVTPVLSLSFPEEASSLDHLLSHMKNYLVRLDNDAFLEHDIKFDLDKPLPPILALHLARFTSHPSPAKITKQIDIPLELVIEETRYALSSMICHRGTLASGHYVASCKRGPSWHCLDDATVTTFAKGVFPLEKLVIDLEFAHLDFSENELTPYLLFYEKRPLA